MANLQMQWDLTRTSDSTVSFAQGFIRASTSDNVQPLALLACEKFGATLAICPDTRRNVEYQILKAQSRPAAIVSFLGATIGYSKDDCGTYLAQSLAGIQFLALAATLVPGLTAFEGGQVLAKMLEASASDKTQLPPTRHLKDILSSIEHRCMQLRFSNLVEGWKCILQKPLDTTKPFNFSSSWIPDDEGVEKLVGAFRELCRVGDVVNIMLKVSLGAPWVAAFTQWCLGVPPNIITNDGGRMFPQPQSKVTILVAPDIDPFYSTSNFRVFVCRRIDGPSNLIHAGKVMNRHGMISIEAYGARLLNTWDRSSDGFQTSLPHVLPYALKLLSTLLRVESLRDSSVSDKKLEFEPHFLNLSARPFPEDSQISQTMTLLLGRDNGKDWTLKPLPKNTSFFDLPSVKEVKETCNCSNCKLVCDNGKTYVELRRLSNSCQLHKYFTRIAEISTVILAISLFSQTDEESDGLLILQGRISESKVQESALFILTTGLPANFPLTDLLGIIYELVGHNCSDNFDNLIVSSSKGQTLYPRIFDTQKIDLPGYLMLNWSPGKLMHNGEVYESAIADRFSIRSPGSVGYSKDPDSMPANLFPKSRVCWSVTPGDGYLGITFHLLHSDYWTNPIAILENLSSALIVPGCNHNPRNKIQKNNIQAACTSPENPEDTGDSEPDVEDGSGRNEDSDKLCIVAVSGKDDLRMFTLSNYKGVEYVENTRSSKRIGIPMVVRNSACLDCCLEVCEVTGYRVIVC